ncbi:lipid-A-disaccharide synthase [Vibrio maritimus]|uniref:Lipid-A-disaccharide synthase n=1 Tax=Vibrio maritimus TaxID=990268 RepID=A0A090T865_9VIBR|nr:lipid-A-disaccharide synthase [Vibrio maritimus]
MYPENLYAELTRLLNGDNQEMIDKFTEMHHWIRKDADKQAADAVLKLINRL